MPRDIEAEVAELDDVYLYTIDDLDKVVMEGQTSRESAAVDANRILDDEISRYLSMERAKEVAPLITSLRENADALRSDVLRQARRRLAQGASGDEVLEYATAALMKKLLHSPSVKLREAGENSEEDIIAAARLLFGLSTSTERATMKETIRHKLESVRDRFEEIAGLLADPDVISDQNQFRDLSKEYSRVEPDCETVFGLRVHRERHLGGRGDGQRCG